ncbi:MAG: ATP-dependent DNA helicase, partial [Candidatus Aenigmatarchaeota archaeon]
MLNFPFENKRPGQAELMEKIDDCLKNSKSLLVHAPTGIGKTVSALYPAIRFAQENGLTVFYLTPRHSQHAIALNTLKKMGEVRVTDIMGKQWLCNQMNEEFGSVDFHEICNYLKKEGKCNYYNNTLKKGELSDSAQKKINALTGRIFGAGELKDLCPGLCPYEVACHLARRSEVIIGDYFHLFNPFVSDTFLAKINKKLSESVVIVDEAHQLPSRVRDLISTKLTAYMLENAAKEARDAGSAIQGDILRFQLSVAGLVRKKLSAGEEEAYIDKSDLTAVFNTFGADFLDELRNISDMVKDAGKKRSFCGSLANFIDAWIESDDNFARIAKKTRAYGSERYELCLSALLPSAVSKGVIAESRSTILMSATLQPLKMYADILGMGNYETISLKSAFPRENRLNIVAPIATTRYAQRGDIQYRNYAEIISKVCSGIRGNVAAFFPSYFFLQQVEKRIEHPDKFIEEQE